MKQSHLLITIALALAVFFISCKKNAHDFSSLSQHTTHLGQAISGDTLIGTLKGTLLPNKTYYMTGPVTIAQGDTLFFQSGDTIYVINPLSYFLVQGTLLSIGTQAAPIWITVPGIPKMNTTDVASNPASDSAFTSTKLWQGIQCDVTCPMLVVKWTHIEFVGTAFVNQPLPTLSVGNPSWPIYFENPNGFLIVEDSWIYGTVDDAVRMAGGKINFMRNTLEKVSFTSGDVLNAKHGTVGVMAYNLFVGAATNGTKASDKGSEVAPACQIDMYNNTYVNCGFRQTSANHGGCIDYEQSAFGQAYNNLIVNCKIGFRIAINPIADTADCHYSHTFNYGDSSSITNQFYPVGFATEPKPSDIPAPSILIPNYSSYVLGAAYDGSSQALQDNPQFVNYPLPCPSGFVIDYAGGFDFHLQNTSPAIGKGYIDFTPNFTVPVDPIFGASILTGPGSDMGCYQSNGTGNQH